jgi:hypothetical protein
MLVIVGCPECGQPAEVLDRFVLASTDGPTEHMRLRCLAGHPLMLPVDALDRAPVSPLN